MENVSRLGSEQRQIEEPLTQKEACRRKIDNLMLLTASVTLISALAWQCAPFVENSSNPKYYRDLVEPGTLLIGLVGASIVLGLAVANLANTYAGEELLNRDVRVISDSPS